MKVISWNVNGIRAASLKASGNDVVCAQETKASPGQLNVTTLGLPEFDAEGRTLVAEFRGLTVISAYFPNSRDGGDYNIAHKPIDLARPEENESSAGYLPEERAWMDLFLSSGFADTFRVFNQDEGNYTWWSHITRARERNIGWRSDYHRVPEYLKERVVSAGISSDVMGSDHCPVSVEINVGVLSFENQNTL